MNRIARPALCALLLLCAAPRPLPAGEPPPPAAPLRKGDALLVRIGHMGGGLPAYREIVDSDGQIEIPFLGLLSAEGKTPDAVASEMAAAYAKANLDSAADVRIAFITHFDPPPSRSALVRVQDPRRPVPPPAPPPPATE